MQRVWAKLVARTPDTHALGEGACGLRKMEGRCCIHRQFSAAGLEPGCSSSLARQMQAAGWDLGCSSLPDHQMLADGLELGCSSSLDHQRTAGEAARCRCRNRSPRYLQEAETEDPSRARIRFVGSRLAGKIH